MIAGVIVGTFVITLATIAIGVFVDRKVPVVPRGEDMVEREHERKQAVTHAAGEAAATAIRAGAAQIDKMRAAQRCAACRAVMTNTEDDAVRYDDKELLVLQFRCPACPTKRSLYIERASR